MAPRRRLLLWGSLAVTVAAAIWVDRDSATDQSPKHPRQAARRAIADGAPAAGKVPAPTALAVADLARSKYSGGHADLFPGRNWAPPALPIVAEPAERPGPPPLPFAYIGQQFEARGPVLFLLYQERTLAVRQGDVIDGTYRLDKITPRSAELVYLPLKQQQSLELGSTNR